MIHGKAPSLVKHINSILKYRLIGMDFGEKFRSFDAAVVELQPRKKCGINLKRHPRKSMVLCGISIRIIIQ